MKFIALLITFIMSAAWIITTAVHYGTVYRIEHEKMIMELMTRHRGPATSPDATKIPGGVEIPGGAKLNNL